MPEEQQVDYCETCGSCEGLKVSEPIVAVPDRRRIALAGNPNVGKTTLFNALTGLRQKTGNYSGVTVERKWGRLAATSGIEIVDLPGTYSLTPRSVDEKIARKVLTGQEAGSRPDLTVCVVDATNLERSLSLALEIIALGIPTIVAVNLIDEARRSGIRVNADLLSRRLGVPVVVMAAAKREGVLDLRQKLLSALPVNEITHVIPEDTTGRFHYISELLRGVVTHGLKTNGRSFSDQLDAVLMHRVAGPLIFIFILFVVFQAVFTWATPAMDAIESGMGALGSLVRTWMPAGLLQDAIVDGVIGGVGAVLVFLPQILLLFFFISFLEDTGYMARAAFISDRIMSRFGLNGRAVVPLVGGYACAVPAIMATRTIENHHDRLVAMMVIPLMSCSARLPIYVLLVAAIVPAGSFFGILSWQALALFTLYVVSTLLALCAAWVMKKVVVRGPWNPLLIELPPFRMPQWGQVLWRMVDRARLFVAKAGKIILVMSLVLWVLSVFPRYNGPETDTTARASLQIQQSYVGQIGHVIEPVFRPLGFDWKISAGIVTAFAAREVLVSTLATIYSVGDDDETALRERLKSDLNPETGRPVFTPLVALSLILFFMVACQCMSTLAITRRETNSWRWPIFMFTYMTTMAWILSFVVYQSGRLMGF